MTDKEILEYGKRLAQYKKDVSTLETAAPDLDEQVKDKFIADAANRAKFIDATVLIGAATKEFRNIFGVDAPHYAISNECYLAIDRNGNGRFYDYKNGEQVFDEGELLTVEDPMNDNEQVTNYLDCWEIANAARFDSNMTCSNYFGDNNKALFVDKQRFFIDKKKDSTSSPAHNPVCPPGFEKWAGRKVYSYICKCFDLDEISLYRLLGGSTVQTIPTQFTIKADGSNKFDCNINEDGVITKNSFQYKYYRKEEDENGNIKTTEEIDDEPIIDASNNGQALPKGCIGTDLAPIKWYKYRVVDNVTKIGNVYRHDLQLDDSPFANSDLSIAYFDLISTKGKFNEGCAILARNQKQKLPDESNKGPGYFDIEYSVNIIWRKNKEDGNLDLGDTEVKTKKKKFLWWSWEKKTTVNHNYSVVFKPINTSTSLGSAVLSKDVMGNLAKFIFNMEEDCLKYYNWIEERDLENNIPNLSESKAKIKALRDAALICSKNPSRVKWNNLLLKLKERVLFDILERDATSSESSKILNFDKTSTQKATAQLNGTKQYIRSWESNILPKWPKWLKKLLKIVSWPVYTDIQKIEFSFEQTESSFLNARTTSQFLSKEEYKGPKNGDLTSILYANTLITLSELLNKLSLSQKIALYQSKILNSFLFPTKLTIGGRNFYPGTDTNKYEITINRKLVKIPTYDNIKRAQTIDGFMNNNASMYFDAFSTLGDRINKRTGTLRELYSLLESTNINAQMIRQKQNNISNLSKYLNTYEIVGGIGTNIITIKLAPWEPAAMAYSNLERMGTVYIIADNTTTKKVIDTSKLNINNQYVSAAEEKLNKIIFDKNYVKAVITEIIDKISDTQYSYELTSDSTIDKNKVYYVYDESTAQYLKAAEKYLTDSNLSILYEQSAYPSQGPIFKVTLDKKIPDSLKGKNPVLIKIY